MRTEQNSRSACCSVPDVRLGGPERLAGFDAGGRGAYADVVQHLRWHLGETYPLTGAHIATPCLACHLSPVLGHERVTFRFADQGCISCHAEDNPHGDQFEDDLCSSCHVTESFRLVTFDHSDTRFPLDGEHSSVSCVSCHEQVPQTDGSVLTRFKPLGTDCKDCH